MYYEKIKEKLRQNIIITIILSFVAYIFSLSFVEFLAVFVVIEIYRFAFQDKDEPLKPIYLFKRVMFIILFSSIVYVLFKVSRGFFGLFIGLIVFSLIFAMYRIATNWDTFMYSLRFIEIKLFGKTQDKTPMTLKEVERGINEKRKSNARSKEKILKRRTG